MNVAVILAGGSGKRMAQDIPKQFLNVNNQPIIIHTLKIFQTHPAIDRIVVVCIPGWEQMVTGYAKQFNITKLYDVVAGGNTRYESMRNGIMCMQDLQEDDIIITHDGVRPMVSDEIIDDVITVCSKHGNAMPIVPCSNTMYSNDGTGKSNTIVNRDTIVGGQTPEAIKYSKVKEMYDKVDELGIESDTIQGLQIALGWDIYFSKGSNVNIKLTTVEDIQLFEALQSIERESWLK